MHQRYPPDLVMAGAIRPTMCQRPRQGAEHLAVVGQVDPRDAGGPAGWHHLVEHDDVGRPVGERGEGVGKAPPRAKVFREALAKAQADLKDNPLAGITGLDRVAEEYPGTESAAAARKCVARLTAIGGGMYVVSGGASPVATVGGGMYIPSGGTLDSENVE